MSELENNEAVTSAAAEEKRNQLNQIFDELKNKFESDSRIEVEIISLVKGGFRVTYKDLPLFLPFRLFTKERNLSDEEMAKEIGKKITVAIIDFIEDEFARIVKISYLKAIEDERWKDIEIDKEIVGTVKAIIPQGIVFDINGMEAFAPINRISKNRIENLEEFTKVGDTFKTTIINADRSRNKIVVSLRENIASHFANILDKLVVGEKIKGKIKNIIPAGLFIELAPGLDGFVKNSEISWLKLVRAESLFTIGQEIEVEILSVDKDEARVNLSYRRANENNWEEIAGKYAEGTEYTGVVSSILRNGVIVLLNDEIEGFMPKGRMQALMNGNKINLKELDTVQVRIIEKNTEKFSMIFESTIKPKKTESQEEYNNYDNSRGRASRSSQKNSNTENDYSLADLLDEKSKKILLRTKNK